jgi:hypothetical protein
MFDSSLEELNGTQTLKFSPSFYLLPSREENFEIPSPLWGEGRVRGYVNLFPAFVWPMLLEKSSSLFS